MSHLQKLLNERLGLREFQKQTVQIINNAPEPSPEPRIPEPSPEPVAPEPVIKDPPIIKNPRGAGRKKITPEEKQKRREEILKKLTNAKNDDVQIIEEIKNNSNKAEINEEIKKTKKKLKLLSDSLNFID